MKAYSWTTWGLGTTLVYLLEDRVEVGVVSTGYVEELRRVFYRDAVALVVWRTSRPRLLVVGWTLIGLGVACGIAVLSGSATEFLVAAVVALAGGAAFLYAGRTGTVLQFRVDGTRGSVTGVMTGSMRKQERFIDELRARIDARQTP